MAGLAPAHIIETCKSDRPGSSIVCSSHYVCDRALRCLRHSASACIRILWAQIRAECSKARQMNAPRIKFIHNVRVMYVRRIIRAFVIVLTLDVRIVICFLIGIGMVWARCDLRPFCVLGMNFGKIALANCLQKAVWWIRLFVFINACSILMRMQNV